MTPSTRTRWTLYALAAALSVAAALGVGDPAEVDVVQAAARAPAAPAVPPAAAPRTGDPLALPAERGLPPSAGDPFEADVAAPDLHAAAARSVPPMQAPPVAPPLPFAFLGRWHEHGRTTVFLGRDERSYKVERPGPLDADYEVLAIAEQHLALRYLPLGLVQELRFDAPPPAATRAAAPPARAASEPEPDKADN